MSTTDDLTKNYSGLLGNILLARNIKGRTIITIPQRSTKREPTENQVTARRKFTLAARYAKNILQDPDMLAAYTARSRPGLSPYILAVTDYLKPPFVDSIDASGYRGNPGDKIGVTAGDDFELSSVGVKIADADGIVIEQGVCSFDLITGNYIYTATVAVSDVAGVTIVAKATDVPGHMANLSVTL